MSEMQSLVCPTCGAPLQFKGTETQITCGFCGNVMAVPAHLRAQPVSTTRAEPSLIVVQLPTATYNEAADYSFRTSQQPIRTPSGCVRGVTRLFAVLIATLSISVIGIFTNSAVRRQIVTALDGIIGKPTAPGQPFGIAQASQVPGQVDTMIATILNKPSTVTSTPASRSRTPDAGFAVSSTPAPVFVAATSASSAGLLTFGGEGTGPGLFKDARYIDVDGAGNVYVGEYDPPRIQRFDANGKYLNGWIVDGKKPLILAMTVDRAGTVYVVANTATNTLLRYEGATGKALNVVTSSTDTFEDITALPDGKLQAIVTHNSTSDDLVRMNPDGKVINRFPKFLSTQTDNHPIDIHLAVDGVGTVFVVSSFDYAVFKFSASGKYVNRFGQKGETPGHFQAFNNAIAVDSQSRVYVGDFKGILVFDADGRYLTLIKIPQNVARSMAFNDKNELYALGRNQVVKMSGFGGNAQ